MNSVLRTSLMRYVDNDAEVGEAWDHFLELAGRAGGRSPSGRRSWRRDELQRELRTSG